jgi:hypothetical protein
MILMKWFFYKKNRLKNSIALEKLLYERIIASFFILYIKNQIGSNVFI